MKKLTILLAVLMLAGSVPAWCVIETADAFVDSHTKNSAFRPIQDGGEIYATVNKGIGSGMDKVPLLQDRSKVMSPLNKLLHDAIDGSKALINATWDLLTFKSMREKK